MFVAEPVYGRDSPAADAPGRRIFDVYCNGKVLVSGLVHEKSAADVWVGVSDHKVARIAAADFACFRPEAVRR